MIPPKSLFTKEESRLLKSFRKLDSQKKSNVIAFAEFMASGKTDVDPEPENNKDAVPKEIKRPEAETVIAGIRRLSESYFMLDKGEMLDDTSVLVSAHLLQGRSAKDVIDELEEMFNKEYKKFKNRS